MSSSRHKCVLGVDPGTYTGWAVYYLDRIMNSGTVSFADQSNLGYGAMFVAFREFLTRLHKDHGPFAAIAYELPFMGGGSQFTTRTLWGMAAHIQERCAVWQCRPLPVNTMTLKKFATGSGKAKKPEMIVEAQRLVVNKVGVLEMTEHEADAIHIARWAWTQLEGNGSP